MASKRQRTSTSTSTTNYDALIDENKDLRERVESIQSDYDKKYSTCENQRAAAVAENKDLLMRIVDLEERQAELEAERIDVDNIEVVEQLLEAQKEENKQLKGLLDSSMRAKIEPVDVKPSPSSLPTRSSSSEVNDAKFRVQISKLERSVRTLTRENAELMSRTTALSHQVATLTKSNERLKPLEAEVARLRSDAVEVEETKKIWASWRKDIEEALGSVETSSSASSSHLPQEVSGIVRRIEQGKRILLQKEDALLQERGRAKKLQRDVDMVESQLSEKDEELRAGKIECSKMEKELNTTKSELRQVKMENKSLTGLMSTYESKEGGDNKAPTGEINSAEGPTVQALRTQVKNAEERNESIGKELDEEREKLGKVTDKFYKLKKEMERQRDLKEKAEERADKAEIMAGKGSYNSDKTRILHLSKNPLQEAIVGKYKAMLEEVKEEKDRLEMEIAAMRSSGRIAGGGTPLPTPSKTPSKSKSLIDHEKIAKRLKEGFQKQTALYRDAVYNLTGYKIDLDVQTGNIKLRSMYAENEGDHLLFANSAQSSAYELLVSDFAMTLEQKDPQALIYLKNMKSIPAFLSNITLTLFSDQTYLG